MDKCETCEHLRNTDNRIAQTDDWVVALAPDQGYLGRCYVSLRSHKGSLAELSEHEWREFARVATALENAAKKAFEATPLNWACMMNNAYQRGEANPHVHWHFRPRYKTPVIINGTEFSDPLYGHHYDRDQRRRVDDKTFQAILSKLKGSVEL